MKTVKNVYSVTGDSKEQITVLCAGNAVGDVLPPMQVFADSAFQVLILDAYTMVGVIPNCFMGVTVPSSWR